MIRSAALGGLFIGVLSALPILGAANCCCCLWIVSGGALASFLEQQQKNRTLTPGEGAAVGAFAGMIGALVWLIATVVLQAVLEPLQRALVGQFVRSARDFPPETLEWLRRLSEPGSPWTYAFWFLVQLFVGSFMASLGGLLGAMYFKKEVPPALGGSWVPPLPPQ